MMPYYLPGYQGGGPPRTVYNLTDSLGDEFEFLIVTPNVDFGSSEPYPVDTKVWHTVGKARVLYRAGSELSLRAMRELLRGLRYDILLVNGIFPLTSIKALLLRRLKLIPDRPALIAPRGECANRALAIKPYRKRLFFLLSKIMGLFQGIDWLASSDREKAEIATNGPVASETTAIHVASDLFQGVSALNRHTTEKCPGHIKVVFLSRILAIKNLHLALQALAQVRDRVDFDIYGPIEDARYWQQCLALIERLGTNVNVSYLGPLQPAAVVDTLSQYHLFFLPTGTENFGYAILEALAAACPVLISDQTQWRDLNRHQAGWIVPLADTLEFSRVVQSVAEMSGDEWFTWSAGAQRFAIDYIKTANRKAIEDNRKVFLGMLQIEQPKSVLACT